MGRRRHRWKQLDLWATPAEKPSCHKSVWKKTPSVQEHLRTRWAVRVITRCRLTLLQTRRTQESVLNHWRRVVARNRHLRSKWGLRFLMIFLDRTRDVRLDTIRVIYAPDLRQMWKERSLKPCRVQSRFLVPVFNEIVELIAMNLRNGHKLYQFCNNKTPCLMKRVNACPFPHREDVMDGDVVTIQTSTRDCAHARALCVIRRHDRILKPYMIGLARQHVKTSCPSSLLYEGLPPGALSFKVTGGQFLTQVYTARRFRHMISEMLPEKGYYHVSKFCMLCLLGTQTDNALGFLLRYPQKGAPALAGLLQMKKAGCLLDILRSQTGHVSPFTQLYCAAKQNVSNHVLRLFSLLPKYGGELFGFDCSRYGPKKISEAVEKYNPRTVWQLRYVLATLSPRSLMGVDAVLRLQNKFNLKTSLVWAEYLIRRGIPAPALFTILSMILI